MKLEIIQNSYLYLPGFITPEEAGNLAAQFKKYADDEDLDNDPQAEFSQSMYNYLPLVKLLVAKIGQVSEFLGEPVLPTYVYSRIYKANSFLARHRDRPACEISLTLNLRKDVDWPIYFQRPDGVEVSVELNPGDAVMYLGCTSDHWREQFQGQEHIQAFLHYVRTNGDKAWAFFDRITQQPPTPSSDDIPVTSI